MFKRLVRHRRAREAAFRLKQELWEISFDEKDSSQGPSPEKVRTVIPSVLEPLRGDPFLENGVRQLLEQGRTQEATDFLKRHSSPRFYILTLFASSVFASVPILILSVSLARDADTRTTISNPGPDCAKELEEGLLSIRDTRDYHYEVTEQDASTLMTTGRVTLGYFRDGIPVEVSFAIRQAGGSCSLSAWQVRRDLGQRWEGARGGDFGQVDLRQCSCQ